MSRAEPSPGLIQLSLTDNSEFKHNMEFNSKESTTHERLKNKERKKKNGFVSLHLRYAYIKLNEASDCFIEKFSTTII